MTICSRLTGGLQKDMSRSPESSETVNVTLFAKKVLTDVITLRILKCNHSGLSVWVLMKEASVLISHGKGEDADIEKAMGRWRQRLQ